MMVSLHTLSIEGHHKERVPHTFFRQNEETGHAAIVFPGWGYTVQMPLLYYTLELMLSLKADVLTVEYDYSHRKDFKELDNTGRTRCLLTDVRSAYHTLLKQRSYQQITIIGKSLGTRAMGYLLTEEAIPANVRAIWLTPILKDETLRQQIHQYGGRSLFISGTVDPHYDADYMIEVNKATNGRVVLIDGGDHSLNIKDNIKQSILELERVIESIKAFVLD
jgi:hypothetical protein